MQRAEAPIDLARCWFARLQDAQIGLAIGNSDGLKGIKGGEA